MSETNVAKPASTIGLRDVVVVKLLTDTAEGTTYDTTVKKLATAISVQLSENNNDPDVQYYDDVEGDVLNKDPELKGTFELADILPADQAFLLGAAVDSKGVMVRKATDKAPYCAWGFKSVKSNGEDRYVWLYKGRASMPNENYATKQGADITRQTAKMEVTFIKRTSDDMWKTTVDANTTAFASVKASFFDAPYAPSVT